MAEVTDLTDQIAALETTLNGTVGMVSTFEAELSRMQDSLTFTGREVATLASGFSNGLSRAFGEVVFGGTKLNDALRGLAQSMSQTVFNTAMRPVTNAIGGFLAGGLNGLLGGRKFADGGAFVSGQVMPFARGGIVSQPTAFGMRGGTGLMGEAGPEAIMPLARGPDGKLGVRSAGGAGVTVVMNIQTPDVAGFQRSQSQIAAQAMQALSRGNRNR